MKLLVFLEKLHVGATADQGVLPHYQQVVPGDRRMYLLCGLTSYWTTRVLPLLSIFLGNLAEIA